MNKTEKQGKTMKKARLRVKTQLTAANGTAQGNGTKGIFHLKAKAFERGTVFEVLNDEWKQWTLRAEDGTEWKCGKARLEVLEGK
tara:strand:- start:314 stop:568 length:255 start_codon:yes stop_codon:yes gene_type:complete